MKLLLFGFISVFSILFTTPKASAFVNLHCFSLNDDTDNQQVLLLEQVVYLECNSLRLEGISLSDRNITGIELEADSNNYLVSIEGWGLGFRTTLTEAVVIHCPTVRRDALGVNSYINPKNGETKEGVTEFYGVKTSVGAVMGADAGMFFNKNGGACFLLGVQGLAVGFGVSGAQMTIHATR